MRPSGLARRLFRHLFRWISGADHPSVLNAPDGATLRRRLDWLDDRVPPHGRRQRRHQAHKEWFCARRYLLALEQAGLLAFPLSVRKTESPDFLLTTPDGPVGLEVSEILTAPPLAQGKGTVHGSAQGKGTVHGSMRESVHESVHGAVHGLVHGPGTSPPGAAGSRQEEPEGLAAFIAARVQAKVDKIARNKQWQRALRHDLLLYDARPDNGDPGAAQAWEAHLAALQAAVAPLLSEREPQAWPAGPPGRVSVLTGGVLLYDLLGEADVLPVPGAAEDRSDLP